jgi:hypothetical protein
MCTTVFTVARSDQQTFRHSKNHNCYSRNLQCSMTPCHGRLEATGRIPLLIEGDDGTHMDRRAVALRVGTRELLGG